MERNLETNCYQETLNSLFAQMNKNEIEKFFRNNSEDYQMALFSCNNTFYGMIERDLIIVKKRILEEIHKRLAMLEVSELNVFEKIMQPLTLATEFILKEGVISVYADLLELEKKNRKSNTSRDSQFAKLLAQTLRILDPLLRSHFVLKELNKQKMLLSSQGPVTFSSKSIENGESCTENKSAKQLTCDSLFTNIYKQIEKQSISSLLHEELEGQQKQISKTLETCRICSKQFTLDFLQRHVSYCSKKQAFKVKRLELMGEGDKLIESVKKQMMKTNRNQRLMKIFRTIVLSCVKSDRISRRSSLIGQKKNQGLNRKVSDLIEEYHCGNQRNQLLVQFQELNREKRLLEKQIQNLQMHYLSNEGTQPLEGSSLHSIRSSIKKSNNKLQKALSIKTKKSLFAKKSDSSSKMSGSVKNLQEIKKTKSIKANDDDMISVDLDEGKMHRSMTEINYEDEKSPSARIENFQILKFLGKGAFGKVYLARRKNTKDLYALKVIKIEKNWTESQLKLIQNEHEIFKKIAGDHLVKASFSFTEGSAHFFVLEYMPGGDLSKLLAEEVYFDYEQAKFYLAEIVLAIEHLHCFGIIHRDLKPENLVFDENGHLKLTDFGLSEIRINDKISMARKRDTDENFFNSSDFPSKNEEKPKAKAALVEKKSNAKIIGTPDYIAPEIITKKSLDNLSIDWWSFGVMAYEMMIGCRPFADDTIEQVINNIVEQKMTWPQIGEEEDMILPVAADFIKKLLNKNYEERLGATNVDEIKDHPFFHGIDWENIKQQNPPIMPVIDSLSSYEDAEADSRLNAEVIQLIKNSEIKSKSNLKLENFVRYDLLLEQTLESAQKTIEKEDKKLKKLKSLVSNMSVGKNRAKRDSLEIKFKLDQFDFLN